MRAKSLQSCLTLCDPMGCSQASLVHALLQVRILEWVAMPSSRGSSRPRDGIPFSCISCIGRRILNHTCHLASPQVNICRLKQLLLIQPYFLPMDLPTLDIFFKRVIHYVLFYDCFILSILFSRFIML